MKLKICYMSIMQLCRVIAYVCQFIPKVWAGANICNLWGFRRRIYQEEIQALFQHQYMPKEHAFK